MQLLTMARRLFANPLVKRLIVGAILLITIIAFTLFFMRHPMYLRSLRHSNPFGVVSVIGLYIVMQVILAGIYNVQLRLCGHTLQRQENFLLAAYTSLINFFGPLQSGPGFRAVYLKQKHQVRLRDYTFTSLLYYGLFAGFSALFLLVATRPWWQTLLVLMGVCGLSTIIIRTFRKRDSQGKSQLNLTPRWLSWLIVLTFVQVLLTGIIYYLELKLVHANNSPGQALSYAGAANFALFVSLTPGAIGFREGFLYLSSQIHHVATANILAANLIDRGAYVLFLGLLFVFVIATHAQKRLTGH